MKKCDLIKFLSSYRGSRILLEKQYREGYFDQYPERKEAFEEMNKREVKDFLSQNPNAMEAIKAIFKYANEHLNKLKGSGKETKTDQLMIDDIQSILDIPEEKNLDSNYEVDDEFYHIIKIISGASCLRYRRGTYEGGDKIEELLKSSSRQTLENALKMAKEVDDSGSIADSLDLEIFKAGLRDSKASKDLDEK